MAIDPRPLVMHVVHRFDIGGLENGVVNLINHLPEASFRHAVLALTEVTAFAKRVRRADVAFIALHKQPGQGMKLYPKIWRWMREHTPAIVHTRNLGALDAQVPAWASGVPVRIHGEHGRELADLHGRARRYQWVRKLHRPFVQHQIALSRDLADYLRTAVGVPADAISQIYNGVDTLRFAPAPAGRLPIADCPFDASRCFIVGTVGRMQPVKDQLLLARAFARALMIDPTLRDRVRLALIGEGPLRAQCEAVLASAGLRSLAWLPGNRGDVPDVMRGLSAFVLPSLGEGISNTILEAMASGLPVVATSVGGNPDLVRAGVTGELVPPGDVEPLAQQIVRLARHPQAAAAMGAAGRAEVERRFSLQAMVRSYHDLYHAQLERAGVATVEGH